MRTFLVYKEHSEHARAVEEYLHDFAQRTGKVIETVDPDSPAGITTCSAYGIVQYPTLVAADDMGVMQNMWAGLPLPTISEISYYVR